MFRSGSRPAPVPWNVGLFDGAQPDGDYDDAADVSIANLAVGTRGPTSPGPPTLGTSVETKSSRPASARRSALKDLTLCEWIQASERLDLATLCTHEERSRLCRRLAGNNSVLVSNNLVMTFSLILLSLATALATIVIHSGFHWPDIVKKVSNQIRHVSDLRQFRQARTTKESVSSGKEMVIDSLIRLL